MSVPLTSVLAPPKTALRAYQKMRLESSEPADINKAERGRRLAALFESEVWQKDVVPILQRLYDDYLEEVKKKTVDPDVLKVLDDFIVRLGGEYQVGLGAMQRIAARRLSALETQTTADAAKELSLGTFTGY